MYKKAIYGLSCFVICLFCGFSEKQIVLADEEGVGGQVQSVGSINFAEEESKTSESEKDVPDKPVVKLPQTGEHDSEKMDLIGFYLLAVCLLLVLRQSNRKVGDEE